MTWQQRFDEQCPGYGMDVLKENGEWIRRPTMVQREDVKSFISSLLEERTIEILDAFPNTFDDLTDNTWLKQQLKDKYGIT